MFPHFPHVSSFFDFIKKKFDSFGHFFIFAPPRAHRVICSFANTVVVMLQSSDECLVRLDATIFVNVRNDRVWCGRSLCKQIAKKLAGARDLIFREFLEEIPHVTTKKLRKSARQNSVQIQTACIFTESHAKLFTIDH